MKVQGPWTNEFKQSYWLKALNWLKAFKRRAKTKKWQIDAKPTWHMFWKENQLGHTKKNAKRRALNLETKNQARDQGIVQLKDSIYFKLVPSKLDLGPSSKVGLNILLATCQCLHQGSQRIKPSKFYIFICKQMHT